MTRKKTILCILLLLLSFSAVYFLKSTTITKPSTINPKVAVVEETKIPVKPEIQGEDDCTKNNGVWMKGPFGEGPFCNIKYSDGGKTCKDSSDCLSNECISSPKRNSEPTGECANVAINYGCYGLLKMGTLTGYACRD